ncbi:MAG: hypothetical protein AB7O43_00760 [Hyphomicrobiaceae bacterium]
MKSHLAAFVKRWPLWISALILIGIVHLATALVMPYIYGTTGYARLVRNLPAHTFVILPQARPRAQVIPFQTPDARMAICRFDVGSGPVHIRALLPEAGWTLTLYTPQGEGYYSYPSSGDRRHPVDIMVMPPGNQFLGPVSYPKDQTSAVSNVVAPTRRGIAVIQAPINARTLARQTELDLAQAACSRQTF